MMAGVYKRTRLWVDPPFQARLLLRMGAYLFVLVLVILHVAFFFHVLQFFALNGMGGPIDEMYLTFLRQQQPLLLALVLFTPILMYDLLKFSHRVAGPLFRVRRNMAEITQGKRVPPFVPRTGDLMRELIAEFNVLIEQSNKRLEPKAAPDIGLPDSEDATLSDGSAAAAGPGQLTAVLEQK
ncbi:MAG: hypothetical protein ACJ8F7_18990 [Gemmataceae bacterium]